MVRTSIVLLVFAALLSAGCHSGTKSAPPPAASQPSEFSPPALPSTTPGVVSSKSVPKPLATRSAAPQRKAALEAADQLDFASEGGTRAGSYEMWVHVTHQGKPVEHAIVGAVDEQNKLASTAYTNADGDARLLVEKAKYRLVARRHHLQADEPITFAQDKDFSLELR